MCAVAVAYAQAGGWHQSSHPRTAQRPLSADSKAAKSEMCARSDEAERSPCSLPLPSSPALFSSTMLRPAVGLARRSARASFALRRPMSMAAPAQLQQYRSNAEDKLLSHLARVAAATQAEGKLEQSGELYAHLVNARRERHGDAGPAR